MALKENQTVKPLIDMAGECIVWEFRNKTPLRLDMRKVHADNIRRAAYVGIAQQRVVDGAAVSAADKDGRLIPVAERDALKYQRMQAIINHLESGSAEWNRRTTAGEGTEIVLRAYARVKGIDAQTAQTRVTAYAAAKFGGDTGAALKFIGQGKEIAQMVVTLRSEGIVASVDADAALDDEMLR